MLKPSPQSLHPRLPVPPNVTEPIALRTSPRLPRQLLSAPPDVTRHQHATCHFGRTYLTSKGNQHAGCHLCQPHPTSHAGFHLCGPNGGQGHPSTSWVPSGARTFFGHKPSGRELPCPAPGDICCPRGNPGSFTSSRSNNSFQI